MERVAHVPAYTPTYSHLIHANTYLSHQWARLAAMETKLRPHRVWTGFLSCGEASAQLFQSHQRRRERQRERGKSESVAIFKKRWEH